MSAIWTWQCAGCGKTEDVELPDGFDPLDYRCYDIPLPPGWVWVSYKSIRFPDRDSRMLGCSEAHAKDAIAKLHVALPE